MAKQKKPSVTSPCVAERHNDKSWSRIIEFSDEVAGGLIEVSDWTVDGVAFVRVEPYRLDADVRVRVPLAHLELSDRDWLELEALLDARKSNAQAREVAERLKLMPNR